MYGPCEQNGCRYTGLCFGGEWFEGATGERCLNIGGGWLAAKRVKCVLRLCVCVCVCVCVVCVVCVWCGVYVVCVWCVCVCVVCMCVWCVCGVCVCVCVCVQSGLIMTRSVSPTFN
jgi:hypothetical protein